MYLELVQKCLPGFYGYSFTAAYFGSGHPSAETGLIWIRKAYFDGSTFPEVEQ